jgi:hypothetical protein
MVSTRSGTQVRALPHRRPARSPARGRPAHRDGVPKGVQTPACTFEDDDEHRTCSTLLVFLAIALSIFVCHQQASNAAGNAAGDAAIASPAPAWKWRPLWPLLGA